jgi:hypothetical protein
MVGGVPQREWNICTLVGNSLEPAGSDGCNDLSWLDYFLLMFLPDQLAVIVTPTSKQLIYVDKPATTAGEILKLFGVLVLITRFEFSSRGALLWLHVVQSKYGRTWFNQNMSPLFPQAILLCHGTAFI